MKKCPMKEITVEYLLTVALCCSGYNLPIKNIQNKNMKDHILVKNGRL